MKLTITIKRAEKLLISVNSYKPQDEKRRANLTESSELSENRQILQKILSSFLSEIILTTRNITDDTLTQIEVNLLHPELENQVKLLFAYAVAAKLLTIITVDLEVLGSSSLLENVVAISNNPLAEIIRELYQRTDDSENSLFNYIKYCMANPTEAINFATNPSENTSQLSSYSDDLSETSTTSASCRL